MWVGRQKGKDGTTLSEHNEAQHIHNTMRHNTFTTQWGTPHSQHNEAQHFLNTMRHNTFTTQWGTTHSQHNEVQHIHNTVRHNTFTTQWATVHSQHNEAQHIYNTMRHNTSHKTYWRIFLHTVRHIAYMTAFRRRFQTPKTHLIWAPTNTPVVPYTQYTTTLLPSVKVIVQGMWHDAKLTQTHKLTPVKERVTWQKQTNKQTK